MTRGVVAAGHEVTAQAAEQILRDGGNAFDAAIAAVAAAFVAEPVLCTPGGGAFMLALPANGKPRIYDAFVQTPSRKRPQDELEFYVVNADFGPATQAFHIGRGAAAVPGIVSGLFEVHGDLATAPMRDLFAPAVHHATQGVRVSRFQAYLFEVVKAIFASTPDCQRIFASAQDRESLVREGDVLRQPELADTLDCLAREGAELFYRGEIAQTLDNDMRDGGHIRYRDLATYEVIRREPLKRMHAGAAVFTNPPPSSGGLLIALGLALLEGAAPDASPPGSGVRVGALAEVLAATREARIAACAHADDAMLDEGALLDPALIARYRAQVQGRSRAYRGTTHVSIIDAAGNLASVTASNGEGCGYVVPGTGIVINNMLGEEDLNPNGFHRWPGAQRMTSMMAPTAVVWPSGRLLATGSGGSNRIRSALLQVLSNVLDLGLGIEEAVHAPRIHLENDLLSIEGGHDVEQLAQVLESFPSNQVWEERNLFFGGVHTVQREGNSLNGAGDARRNGICLIC
ncbi:MAG: gamma-glutamyltransferase [Gammaproteobacteria bacterium]